MHHQVIAGPKQGSQKHFFFIGLPYVNLVKIHLETSESLLAAQPIDMRRECRRLSGTQPEGFLNMVFEFGKLSFLQSFKSEAVFDYRKELFRNTEDN